MSNTAGQMATFASITFDASSRIRNERTIEDVFMHMVTEVGELNQEVIIDEGRSYKEPGKDGVVGEAIDVALCALDIFHLRLPKATELTAVSHLWTGGADTVTDAALRLDMGADIRPLLRTLSRHIGTIAHDIHFNGMDPSPYEDRDMLKYAETAMMIVQVCLQIIRIKVPGVSDAMLADLARPKLDKWIETTRRRAMSGAL